MISRTDPTDEDALRLRSEFLVAPNLRASVDWCARLLGVPRRHALLILDSLVREGFLARTGDEYTRTAPKLR